MHTTVATSNREQFVKLFAQLGRALPQTALLDKERPLSIFINDNGKGRTGKSAIADAITKARYLEDKYRANSFTLETNTYQQTPYIIGAPVYSKPDRTSLKNTEYSFINLDIPHHAPAERTIRNIKDALRSEFYARTSGGIAYYTNTGAHHDGRPTPSIEINVQAISQEAAPQKRPLSLAEEELLKRTGPKDEFKRASTIIIHDERLKSDQNFMKFWENVPNQQRPSTFASTGCHAQSPQPSGVK